MAMERTERLERRRGWDLRGGRWMPGGGAEVWGKSEKGRESGRWRARGARRGWRVGMRMGEYLCTIIWEH